MSKIKIICTLGAKTINRNFLKFSNNKIKSLRLNLSHLTINKLIKNIKFIKKTNLGRKKLNTISQTIEETDITHTMEQMPS